MEPGRFESGKWEECRKFGRAVKNFNPDVVYFWNQAGLCNWLLPVYARWLGCRIVFFCRTRILSPGAWGRSLRGRRWAGESSRDCCAECSGTRSSCAAIHGCEQPDVPFREPVFDRIGAGNTASARRRQGSVVAHWGIEPELFKVAPRERWPVRKLLYAGQVIPKRNPYCHLRAGTACRGAGRLEPH